MLIRVRWQKKHVFGSEGTVAGMGCQTLAFVGWHFPFFLFSNLQSCYCCVVFSACVQRSSVAVVRDYGLHHYQPARNFMRGRTLKYSLKPLLLLHFVGSWCSVLCPCKTLSVFGLSVIIFLLFCLSASDCVLHFLFFFRGRKIF